MAVGDVNSAERGSGARYNDGKPDFSLIPLWTLVGEARVWARGAKKYSAWNWTKGMPWSVPFACAMRHLSAWQNGEDIDPESGESHLDHVACNIRMLKMYASNYPEGDDRMPASAREASSHLRQSSLETVEIEIKDPGVSLHSASHSSPGLAEHIKSVMHGISSIDDNDSSEGRTVYMDGGDPPQEF